jgi:glycosyltransferase involved in cell wall biosynthesis
LSSASTVPDAARSAPTLTIGVLTKNEAHRIEKCLRSAAFANEVIVVDSGSTDDTVALAAGTGATVLSYPDWQGFGVQRSRLLEHATGDYVFFLDADEVVTPELQAQIEAAVRSGESAIWRVRWRMVAYGHELKAYRPGTGPERLFRRDMLVGYQGVVHEEAVLHPQFVNVPRHVLRGKLLHHSRETVRGSLEKLTQYAMLGATKRADARKRGGVLRGMAGGTAMFMRLYLLRLGFLCGGAGFLYCFFVALESFFRYAALYYDRKSLSSQVSR